MKRGMAAKALVPGARHAVAPVGIVATAWPRVESTCNNIGWRFDPWQKAVGRLILAKSEGGGWAADLSILSIPRQVGKSYLLGCIIFALCLLKPGLRVIWTSHHTATTEEMYESMKELASHKKVVPHIKKCVALQGSRWRISFANGSRIDFGARERGFGRGKAKVGVLVLDEFQHISMRALSNLTPTTNTADNPLILCAGTPPTPEDNGEAFKMRRKAALDGISSDSLFVEFSADKDADLDDRRQWAKANPSFPARTPERAFLLNRKVLDDGSFRREFLGIWNDDAELASRIIMADEWKATQVKEPPEDGLRALGVKFSPDGSSVAVSGAMKPESGPIHVELVGAHSGSMSAGTASLVEWTAERWKNYTAIVVDGKSHAGAFVNALLEAGVDKRTIITPTWPEVATANAMLLDAVLQRQMTHLATEGQALLDRSVEHTTKKIQSGQGGGAWSWESFDQPGDEIPIASAALAHWGAKTKKPRTNRAVFA